MSIVGFHQHSSGQVVIGLVNFGALYFCIFFLLHMLMVFSPKIFSLLFVWYLLYYWKQHHLSRYLAAFDRFGSAKLFNWLCKNFFLFFLKCTFEMINWQTESDYVFHSEPMVWKGLQGPMSQASPVSQSNNQNACVFNVKHGWQLSVLITTMHVQSSHYSGWGE